MFKFDQIDFERRFYALIIQEVNVVFSELLKNGQDSIQREGLRVQLQMMQSLHAITEEVAIQGFYGLLANKGGK